MGFMLLKVTTGCMLYMNLQYSLVLYESLSIAQLILNTPDHSCLKV